MAGSASLTPSDQLRLSGRNAPVQQERAVCAHRTSSLGICKLAAGLAVWLVLVASQPLASACPFCDPKGPASGPGQSLALADATVAAKIVGKRVVPAGDVNSTKTLATFEITALVDGELVTVGQRITLTNPRGVLGDARDCVLMLSKDDAGRVSLVDAYPDTTGQLAEYLRQSTRLNKHDFAAKLAFYARHLEHAVPEIADDAYKQFLDIPYETIQQRTDLLPADRLRQWLGSDKVDDRRKGLYGLMLGSAGKAEDEALLRKTLPTVSGNPVAAGGVLAGLCVLTKKPETLIAEVLGPTPPERKRAELGVRQGAVPVLRFLWEQAGAAGPEARRSLHALWRLGLADRDVAPLVVAELAMLNEFALTDDVKAYWADANRLTPKGRLAVFGYQKLLPPAEREEFKKWLTAHPTTVRDEE